MTADPARPLASRLSRGMPLLLDAAMGTELDRRGVRTTLPLWSALGLIEAPELVQSIHLDNLLTGADIVTANTFRTTRRTFRRAGLDPARGIKLNRLAVELGREARRLAGRPEALVAGSIAPLEDCYSPWLSPDPAVALAEHREQARLLSEAGVDLVMVETMPVAAEAEAALRAATETGLEATVGFVCAPSEGQGAPPRLLSGETLAEAVARVEPYEPAAILINCAAPPVIGAALRALRRLTERPMGGYANLGTVDDERGWEPDVGVGGGAYAVAAREWLGAGAAIVGGCCGTTPEHTAALRALLDGKRGDALADSGRAAKETA